MKTIVNPQDYSLKYLENLNLCFPNWGNLATFDWVFNRKFNGLSADYFILNSDIDQLLAGSAISYRGLKKGSQTYSFGIMTGSWTLPISRGMGCFTEAINQSLKLVSKRKNDFLTAFVTESNGSYRRLKEEGSYLIATNYIISQNNSNQSNTSLKVEILEKNIQNETFIYNLRKEKVRNKIHFDYNFEDFKGQFLNRLNATFILKIGDEFAIVEETITIFQLHYCSDYSIDIISEIVNWCRIKNKEVIFFSSDENHVFKSLENYKVIPGFFTILKSESNYELDLETIFNSDLKFEIQYGDKM